MFDRKLKEQISAGLRNTSGNCPEDEGCRHAFSDRCNAPDEYIEKKRDKIRGSFANKPLIFMEFDPKYSDVYDHNWPCSNYFVLRFVEPEREKYKQRYSHTDK